MLKELTPTTKQKDQMHDMHRKTLDNALYQIRSVKGLISLQKRKGEIPLFDPNNKGKIPLDPIYWIQYWIQILDLNNIKANNKPIYIADSTTFLRVAKGIVNGCRSELTRDGLEEVVSDIMEKNYITQNPLREKQINFLKEVDEAIERIPA